MYRFYLDDPHLLILSYNPGTGPPVVAASTAWTRGVVCDSLADPSTPDSHIPSSQK